MASCPVTFFLTFHFFFRGCQMMCSNHTPPSTNTSFCDRSGQAFPSEILTVIFYMEGNARIYLYLEGSSRIFFCFCFLRGREFTDLFVYGREFLGFYLYMEESSRIYLPSLNIVTKIISKDSPLFIIKFFKRSILIKKN